MNKTVALMLVLAAVVAAGLLAASSSGAAQRREKIAFLVGSNDPRMVGARMAAKRLGVRTVVSGSDDVRQLVARHVNAVVGDGFDPTLRPFFRRARKAGIRVLSSGDDIAAKRDVWVSYSGTVAFAQALGDALASQINDSGEYAILDEQGEFPIADTWAKDVAAYIPTAYPNMTLDGVLKLSGAGDQGEVDAVKSFMSTHPNLKGLISITPTEAYMAAAAVTQTNKIGQVFSAGNGGTALKGTDMVGYVKSGATEDVVAGDPVELGCLTVWAAHYLLTGHHFEPGTYRDNGGLGPTCGLQVSYYRQHQELRLGDPLTITKANVDHYAG